MCLFFHRWVRVSECRTMTDAEYDKLPKDETFCVECKTTRTYKECSKCGAIKDLRIYDQA